MDTGVDGFSDEVTDNFRLLVGIEDDTIDSEGVEFVASADVVVVVDN